MHKNIKRRLQKVLLNTSNFFKYKILNMSFWEKIIFGGLLICYISLFFPWIDSIWDTQNIITTWVHPFTLILWRVWYFLLWIIVFTSIVIFKTPSSSLSDYLVKNTISKIFIFSWGAIFLLSLQTLFFIQWIQIFSSEIVYEKGAILSLTGASITIIWGLILRKEKINNNQTGIIRDHKIDSEILDSKDVKNNMKLPF